MKARHSFVSNSSSSSFVIINWSSLSERKKRMIMDYKECVKATWIANSIPIESAEHDMTHIDFNAIKDDETRELAEKLDFGWIDNWYFSEAKDGCMDAMTYMDNFNLGKWLDYLGGVVYRYTE